MNKKNIIFIIILFLAIGCRPPSVHTNECENALITLEKLKKTDYVVFCMNNSHILKGYVQSVEDSVIKIISINDEVISVNIDTVKIIKASQRNNTELIVFTVIFTAAAVISCYLAFFPGDIFGTQ